MMSIEGVRGYSEVPERFQGITELEPRALGHFAFFVASNTIQNRLSSNLLDMTGEPEEWEFIAREIVERARTWEEGGRPVSRYEFAQRIQREQEREVSMEATVTAAKGVDAINGIAMVVSWMESNGYTLRKPLRSSPMFPEGREQKISISSLITDHHTLGLPHHADIRDEDDALPSQSVFDYICKEQPDQRNHEAMATAMELISPIDPEHYEELREQYGAKAAALLCFEEKVAAINEATEGIPLVIRTKIPPFIPVSVDTYDLWKRGATTTFGSTAESLRQQILELTSRFGTYFETDLVAVRSSAVHSEDGEEYTGAGVYVSVTADPNDPVAFRNAIERVYESCDSPSALSYRQLIGIDHEKMGLIIQPYLERINTWLSDNAFFGHANSIGSNPNLIEITTNHGELLYDKGEIADGLLILDRSDDRKELHSYPDHDTDLWRDSNHAGPVAHAAILAEQLFGKPMQLEFVNDNIVQVRPLLGVETGSEMEFPANIEPRFTGRGVGVGDMELAPLDIRKDNSGQRGFVVFEAEYAFTDASYHKGYKAFPNEGAVVIIGPSSSGHIQAYCREKGLLCFYSKKVEEVEQLVSFNENADSDKEYRFISDGYRGSIY